MNLYSDEELAEILNQDIFHQISEAADRLGLECYVVGGYVRDIFLERPSNDIDVVVVGSGIKVAEELKRIVGKKAHLSVFKNFGTAQVKFWQKGTEYEVEFVGARKESYSHDSRKPIVENGTLEDDQNRRDFTINAMAICLNKERFGELVDPFNGLADLEDGKEELPMWSYWKKMVDMLSPRWSLFEAKGWMRWGIIAALAIPALVANKGRLTTSRYLPLLFVAMLTPLWYIVVARHSYTHFYITSRALLVWWFACLCFLYVNIDFKKLKSHVLNKL